MDKKQEIQMLGTEKISKVLLKFSIPCVMGLLIGAVINMTLAHYGSLSQYGQDIPISVFSIQTKVYTVAGNIVTGIVLGGQPIFGYNYGAGKLGRVRQTYGIVLLASVTVGLTATLIFQLKPELVINLFGAGSDLYMEFAKKTFRIYLSLVTVTGLTKMTTVFFQSIGKSVQAVVASLVRDILCFTPLAICLSAAMERREIGSGLNGILFAAPVADAVAAVVILCMSVWFFKNLGKEKAAA